MNIVYNCNEAFAVHTAVSIASLFENNRDEKCIKVYILGNGISKASRQHFAELAAVYGAETAIRNISIIELKDYEVSLKLLFGGKVDSGSFDITVLARLFAPSHLPDSVGRYIYLDADTVVLGSLSGLYATELGGCICGMAAEPTIYADTRRQLGISEDMPYYNSGMMIVDREAWERERITGKCIDFYASVGRKGLAFPDQDILNHVLKNRVRTVWQGYNFFSNYCYRSYRSLTAYAAWYKSCMSREGYDFAKGQPAVVHFAGAERPWLKGNHNPYRNEYKRYLSLTPWRDNKEQGGQEIYMCMYHCMNLLTKVCPPARQLISALYICRKQKK